ncbi:pectate lyase superfamily protein-domain-containing protein [Aspergillus cavernicola]|uniref:Pectate lyase superfamily protein-domain-containing protein n=1 Tax=Aspergillus cavernicola TaxID=176166 RepID=A0ABR4I6M1_9EURO
MRLTDIFLFLSGSAWVGASPISGQNGLEIVPRQSSSEYWVSTITKQGTVPFGDDSDYEVYRDVKEFGAVGDGVTDDTEAINQAISTGDRCGQGCDSSTTKPAVVFFPPGTYLVSRPVIQYYYTQMVGDAIDLPVLKASADFSGMAVIDADPYTDDGSNWYTNQNNFFRAIRNFVVDLTAMPQSSGAGIHWQVGQATSLQNIHFEMIEGGGDANKQQGIFMDNGSGGFMSDLVFNGGNYGMFVGNQQFTSRNLTFNGCNTGVYMNWNWAWTFKSVTFNNCGLGLNMSNSPSNQTVGSVLLLDTDFVNTPTGVVTAWGSSSIPVGAGTLVLDNVDFSGSSVAVAAVDGSTVLQGGSVVSNWVQGSVYRPSQTVNKRATQPSAEEVVVETIVETVYDCGSSSTPYLPLPTSSSTDAAGTSGGILPLPSSPLDSTLPVPGVGSSSEAGSSTAIISETTVPTTASSVSDVPLASTSSASTSGAIHGSSQCSARAVTRTRIQTALPDSSKPNPLLNTANGKVFERSKPLYESYSASSFISVKSAGAMGDGSTDDTAAIQSILDSVTEDQIVYFDHGAYVLTDTIKIPANIKIVGEIWPVLMANGAKFSDEQNPIPLLQVGTPGSSGAVEISDLAIQTKGPAPGAILMQWNVAESSPGAAGMWDVHFRVGGSAGTELQSDKCAKTPNSTTTPNPECIGAFMLLHLTENSTAYLENVWSWTADHELDIADHNQINIYNGRGILVESQGPVWMYGTAAEHNQLYNYQISNAKNIFMGLIQTETPYYQANPNSLVPFTPQSSWNDPDFASCTTNSCRKSWGLRVTDSSDIYVYGAGLYSFFENYEQTCIAEESCQENMVEVDCSDVHIFGLSTIATVNMIASSDGTSLVPQEGNESTFCSTIGLFEQTL